MSIDKDEARAALDEIDSIIRDTKQRIAHGPTGVLLIIWGLIWFSVFLATHFSPALVNWIAPIGCGIGMASMWMVKSKSHVETRRTSANEARVRYAWIVLTAYAILWLVILHPQRSPSSDVPKMIDTINHVMAFFATVGMFGYVIAGLWLGRFFWLLGLVVTVLVMIGLYGLPAHFMLWMAFVGGGALIFSGVMVKRLWAV